MMQQNLSKLAKSDLKSLERLLKTLPNGKIVGPDWFEKKGVSQSILNEGVETGLINRLTKGLYFRPYKSNRTEIGWEHIVEYLQQNQPKPVHVGGIAALEMQGIIHYLRLRGPMPVTLFTYAPLPKWLGEVQCDAIFIVRNANKLFDVDAPGIIPDYKWKYVDCKLAISSHTRAMCEYLDEIDERLSFHNADMLMDLTWRNGPSEIQTALEACKSKKVRRVFLFLADRNEHKWFKNLNLKRINLGSGARQVTVGGIYDPVYKITVPDDLDSLAGYDY